VHAAIRWTRSVDLNGITFRDHDAQEKRVRRRRLSGRVLLGESLWKKQEGPRSELGTRVSPVMDEYLGSLQTIKNCLEIQGTGKKKAGAMSPALAPATMIR